MQLVRHLRLAGAALIVAIATISIGAGNEVKQAEAELKAEIAEKNFDAMDRTLSGIVHTGGADAAKMIVSLAQKVAPGEDMLYWRLLNAAASFQDDAGLGAIADAVLSSSGASLGRDLMFAMQNNRSPKAPSAIHARVLEKGADDLKLMAADQLGLVETVDAVDILIAAYKREEKRDGDVRRRILTSLKLLTGADCGPAAAWESWWAGTRKDGPQGRAKRESTASSGTGTVVDSRGPETEALDKLTADMILVIKADDSKHPADKRGCNFDKIEDLLDQMKIPHTVASVEDFNAGKVALEGRMALILDCVNIHDHCICPTCKQGGGTTVNRMGHCVGCDKHENVNHRLSGSGMKIDPSTGELKKSGGIDGNVKRIKEWVERGGYLFSEDYGIWNELELAWPGILKAGKSIKKREVKCSPARGHTTHPMLRGVFVDSNLHVEKPAPAPGASDGGSSDGGDAGDKTTMRDPVVAGNVVRTWVIDDDSPLIDVVAPQSVTLLMTSEELKKDGGNNGDAVALTFMPSAPASEKFAAEGHPEKLVGGRVMHILSHFGKQNDSKDEFALQNLMLNFLMEGARRFPKGVK